ncbi:hypothetical protein OEG84_19180 [Hoeflea sp. G2-23]|uniref:DUF4352 domain-containing protein n=1 Tax=Hoeflea algicola TaxID=2983763 RepID=A0ABT3ZD90_9HYPH|nr:hypothetical protein [Hoeflea algicola]MCY0149772.1 hypothetical protein [Hoeflea algicola]
MSKRYWIIFIAFGLAALTSEAKAQYPVPSTADRPPIENGGDQSAREYDRTTGQFAIPIIIIEDAENAERAERREADSDQRERDDLTAQQSMAESTERIVFISWWQLGLATAGTILVFGSLGAAFWANWIARDTAKRQLRAYVAVPGGVLSPVKDSKTKLRYDIRIENTGQTPAYNVSCWTNSRFAEYPLTTTLLPPDDKINPMGVLNGGLRVPVLFGKTADNFTAVQKKECEAGTLHFISTEPLPMRIALE